MGGAEQKNWPATWPEAWPEGMQRVAAALSAHGHAHIPVMLDGAARTAQQAADALGVAVGQIAKSIIFRRVEDDVAVLVVTSGDRRVDEAKVAAMVGPLGRASAAFVKERTGFSIGGVSPIAHAMPGVTLIDRDLFRFDAVWAAAGHPHGVFQLHPQDLQGLTQAPVVDVVEGSLADDGVDSQARQNAIKVLAARAISTVAIAENIPSPCVSICRMNTGSGLCEGCFRTIEEICAWSQSNDAAKKVMWTTLTQRLRQTHPEAFAPL